MADTPHYTYLREITAEERAEVYLLVSKSIDRLPFTFASPLRRFFTSVGDKEYGRGMNYALDFFEIPILWLSALLLKRLIDLHKKSRVAVAPVLQRLVATIDTKRPLSFGDSLNSIFIPLVNLARNSLKNDPLIQSLTLHLMRKNTCILLGNKHEPSVVQIRNEYKGHSTTLSENIYKGVIYTLEPRILALLRAVEPLTEGTAFSCHEGMKLSHDGPLAHEPEPMDMPLEEEHYYLRTAEETVDLYPLILCDTQKFVYIFQTLKEESISYVSSDENAVTCMDDRRNEAFDKLIQQIVPSFDISRELNWEQICILAAEESKKILDRAYHEKKYNRELFVDREHLSESLRQFYVEEGRTLFPLRGEAGQGKTNQLCYWVENLLEQGQGVLFFQSSDFASFSLETRLKTIFNTGPRKKLFSLLDNLHAKAEQSGNSLYVFFDAVNECLFYAGDEEQPGPLGLYKDIVRLFINEHYPRFKVLFTCRNYTWKYLLSRETEFYKEFLFHDPDNDALTVRGFSSDELNRAYVVYRELYQMDTNFENISPTARIRLKDPLVLKITCTNYLGQKLPDLSQAYTSIALFNRMFNDIASSYAGRQQRQIIEWIGTYILTRYEA